MIIVVVMMTGFEILVGPSEWNIYPTVSIGTCTSSPGVDNIHMKGI
jgi:hypothetical protein